MTKNNKLRLIQNYPYLTESTGFDQNPVEQLLSNIGVSPTSRHTPVASPGSIGADNKQLASSTEQAVQNIFGLLRNASINATVAASEAAAKRNAEKENAKNLALQARILEAQKKSALNAVKKLPKISVPKAPLPLPSGNPPLIPMPKLPKSKPKAKAPKIPTVEEIKLPPARPPVVKPKPVRDPRKPGVQK